MAQQAWLHLPSFVVLQEPRRSKLARLQSGCSSAQHPCCWHSQRRSHNGPQRREKSCTLCLVGICQFVLVRPSLQIAKPLRATAACGYAGLGNKGAVALRLQVGAAATLCVVTVHLPAGESAEASAKRDEAYFGAPLIILLETSNPCTPPFRIDA